MITGITYQLSVVNPGLNGKAIKDKSKIRITLRTSISPGDVIEYVKVQQISCNLKDGSTVHMPSPLVTPASSTSSVCTFETTTTLQYTGEYWIHFEGKSGDGKYYNGWANVMVYAFDDATVASFLAVRSDASGNPDINGSKIKVYYNYTIDGSNGNTGNALIQIREVGASSWTTLKTLTALSQNSSFVTSQNFDVTKSYELRIVVTDSSGKSVSRSYDLGPATKLISGDKNSIAFGKASSYSGNFEVGLPSQIRLEKTSGAMDHFRNPENNPLYLKEPLDDSFTGIMSLKNSSGDSFILGGSNDEVGIYLRRSDESTQQYHGSVIYKGDTNELDLLVSKLGFSQGALISIFNWIFPVGMALWFPSSLDPNARYPGTTWVAQHTELVATRFGDPLKRLVWSDGDDSVKARDNGEGGEGHWTIHARQGNPGSSDDPTKRVALSLWLRTA